MEDGGASKKSSSLCTQQRTQDAEEMWTKAHAANQEDPVYEKPKTDAKEVELSPNVPC